jgi:uncharacterized iron-regulated protein
MSVFTRSGKRVSFAEVLNAAKQADVVLIGETHDDPVAHQVELLVLASLHKLCPCALSMEMFESDVQDVVDEYMAGLIEEDDFMKDTRPWVNYVQDYRMLVEFAKDVQIPVIAANIPRRYVRAVGRRGPSLTQSSWPSSPFDWLPKLSMPSPSASYMKHVLGLVDMQMPTAHGCPYSKKPNELASAVILWDSAMAHSIAKQLSAHPERSVLHVCGSFHVEHYLGILEMLSHYRESTHAIVIAVYPEDDCHEFDQERHGGAADFVVLTDASLPRTFVHQS